MYYIGSSSTPHNDRWPFVYHSVPDNSPLVIAGRVGCEEFSPNVSLQFFDRCFSNIGFPSRSDNLQVSNPRRGGFSSDKTVSKNSRLAQGVSSSIRDPQSVGS